MSVVPVGYPWAVPILLIKRIINTGTRPRARTKMRVAMRYSLKFLFVTRMMAMSKIKTKSTVGMIIEIP
jgi:hypothetical protein